MACCRASSKNPAGSASEAGFAFGVAPAAGGGGGGGEPEVRGGVDEEVAAGGDEHMICKYFLELWDERSHGNDGSRVQQSCISQHACSLLLALQMCEFTLSLSLSLSLSLLLKCKI